jgi:ribA/ribD-fused uncharacterized protein
MSQKAIMWAEEEAVALFDLYFQYEDKNVPDDAIEKLSLILKYRGAKNGIIIDDKFRNLSGLKMQLGGIQYVVSEGHKGMSNTSKLFYETFEMYKTERNKFNSILRQFYSKYDNPTQGLKKEKLILNATEESAYFFHKPEEQNGFLSNWYPSFFSVNGVDFTSTEQFIMFKKAEIFRDNKIADEILSAKTPREQQRLGKLVSNYNDVVWAGLRQPIAYIGNLEKYRQNEGLREALLSTEDSYLIECAISDSVWACGMSLYNPEKININKWNGKNLLGFTLMEVRNALR